VANPKEVAVLVNKSFRLPEGYKPDPLVEPNVPFIFEGKSEKRMLRKEAADALEKLFAGAKADGVSLTGVSGYRSEATQTTLYNNYVKKDGVEAANKYSAKPGTSEHQTGLAIDVSASTGKCAAEDCFAGTKEAKWLVDHAAEYGYIVRYLKSKESITGYQYEPWHIRFVGKDIAKEIMTKGITLEEYLKQAIPVSK
jgi:D-alanyl-D-alanine carboxypeptidase